MRMSDQIAILKPGSSIEYISKSQANAWQAAITRRCMSPYRV
jgi:hypothetical protein